MRPGERLGLGSRAPGADAVPSVTELFSLTECSAPRSQFWYAGRRATLVLRPAVELPSWFDDEGRSRGARSNGWVAVANDAPAGRTPLAHGGSAERFARRKTVGARAEGMSRRASGGAGPATCSGIERRSRTRRSRPADSAAARRETRAPRAGPARRHRPDAADDTVLTADAEGERRISVWISDPPTPRSPPLPLVDCTVSIRVGEPVAESLVTGADGAIPGADIPAEGLATAWKVVAHRARLAAIDDTATITSDGDALSGSSFRARATAPPSGVMPQADDATLSIFITREGALYRTLHVSLARGGKAFADLASSPLALVAPRTTSEWTTPPGRLTMSVDRVARASLFGDSSRVNDGDRIEIGSDKSTLGDDVAAVLRAADDFRKRPEWTRYLNDIDETALPAAGTFRPQCDWTTRGRPTIRSEGWSPTGRAPNCRTWPFRCALYDTMFRPAARASSFDECTRLARIVLAPGQRSGGRAIPWSCLFRRCVAGHAVARRVWARFDQYTSTAAGKARSR